MSRGAGLLELRPDGEGLALRVRVMPRASRNAIEGVRDGALLVRLTAPPLEGRANQALVRLLAEALGLRRAAVTVIAGASSRDKRLHIDTRDAAAVQRLAQGSGGRGSRTAARRTAGG